MSTSMVTMARAFEPATRPDGRGIIARSLDLFARITPEATLKGAQKYLGEMTREQVAGKLIA